MTNLTEKEINQLPITMRCCYFLGPWNEEQKYQTIEEWAEGPAGRASKASLLAKIWGDSTTEAAYQEAEKLRNFVSLEIGEAIKRGLNAFYKSRKNRSKEYLKPPVPAPTDQEEYPKICL